MPQSNLPELLLFLFCFIHTMSSAVEQLVQISY